MKKSLSFLLLLQAHDPTPRILSVERPPQVHLYVCPGPPQSSAQRSAVGFFNRKRFPWSVIQICTMVLVPGPRWEVRHLMSEANRFTRRTTRVSCPPDLEGCVTKCQPLKALELIA